MVFKNSQHSKHSKFTTENKSWEKYTSKIAGKQCILARPKHLNFFELLRAKEEKKYASSSF